MVTQGVYQSDTNGSQEKTSTKQTSPKTLAECWAFVTKLNDYQLKQLRLCPEGEFYTCASSKEALDVINHLKATLRSKGFGCYALHDYVWIVPFVHQGLHLPDFARAKAVLPDFRSELVDRLDPTASQRKPRKPLLPFTLNRQGWFTVAAVLGVLILAL